MSGDHLDDDRLGAAFDAGTTRRLIRYAWPHRRLFVTAAVLVAVTTLIDLSIPWLTKTAIDRCILLPYEAVSVSEDDAVRPRLLAAGAATMDDGRVLIDPAQLPRELVAEVRARGLPSERCLLLDQQSAPTDIPGTLRGIRGRYLPASSLDALPAEERAQLRRPQLDSLQILGLALLAFVITRMITGYCQALLLQQAGNRVMADIREGVFAHVMRLPIAYFDRNAVGRLVTRATNDVSAVNELFTNVLVYLLRDAISIIGVSIIMLMVDLRLGLAVLAVSPLVVLISWNFRKRARDIFRDARLKLAKLNAYLQESISGVRTIKANAQEPRIAARFDAINHEEYLATMRQVVLNGVYQPLIGLCGIIALAVIIWYGGNGIASHTITVGALVAFTAYVEMLFAPLRDLAEKHNVMQAANASAERIFQLLDERVEPAGSGVVPASCAGAVEFQDVWFSYGSADPGAEPHWVLTGISFVAKPGEHLALIGPTGSGKTTIVNLLLRFHEPQRGRILIDGRDVRELDLHWLRRRFAVVLQDVFLFAGDIRANIALKGDDIDAARIESAARTTHAHDVIMRQPGGYAGTLNERGTVLSVGERQLLSFARALAADPAVLVLDEATASIDSQTERLVQDAMERLLSGRTSLTIAHRLSTIHASDRILVLKSGELIEIGSHVELMARDGLYAALVRRQVASEAAESS
ncbi:MAG: ABC transporter ATP-binding protein [Planctomycetes bacterium]|nr:ABC transporter ATP-binding protein [Planctomycetota bacterium]